MSQDDVKLVWSDDPKDKDKVVGKKKKSDARDERVTIDPASFVAVFRIERGGRGGKTVTVVDQLPRHETFLRELCKELKSKCGSGGTFEVGTEAGVIEIQGDKRDAIKAIFDKKKYRYKG